MRKKLTKDELIEKLTTKFPNLQYTVSGDYLGSKDPILVTTRYGECLVTPNKLLSGWAPCIQSAINKNDYIKRKFIEKHDNRYNYDKFEYVNNTAKSIIICSQHGEFLMSSGNHLAGNNCPECGKIATATSHLHDTETFVESAKQVHGHTYDYSNVEYTKAVNKVEIKCPKGHIFFQMPSQHLRGSGCNKCASLKRGYTKGKYLEISAGRPCKFYVIECKNEEESFYKVGITVKEDVLLRFNSRKSMPYSFNLLHEINGTPSDMWDKEKKAKELLYSFKYRPSLKFAGSSCECVNVNPLPLLQQNNLL